MKFRRGSLEARFWPKVNKQGPVPAHMPELGMCHEWTGSRDGNGYGKLSVQTKTGFVFAHRAAWELEYGPIPHRAYVLHRCDNPPCVRHDHLFLGDARANQADYIEKFGKSVFITSKKRR